MAMESIAVDEQFEVKRGFLEHAARLHFALHASVAAESSEDSRDLRFTSAVVPRRTDDFRETREEVLLDPLLIDSSRRRQWIEPARCALAIVEAPAEAGEQQE